MHSSPRALRLDLLRALAIFLVLGRHMYPLADRTPQPILFMCQLWRSSGWIGVDLFFVVSGFLVSGLLFSEYQQRGKIRIWRFYIRRGFKIYPAFYLMILITAF